MRKGIPNHVSAIADLVGWVEVTKPNITFSQITTQYLSYNQYYQFYTLIK
ncbi:hypothetical protein PANO66_03503 [Planktothrix agardhii]|uniref:Uncharacterized protein n=2 Tax=Planktothrix agardhii TaxID=1160 RepID=A0AAD1Q2Y4_PLAAG|nr:hypothetical protein PANO66_03503 [Planktothrix agardhii]